MMDLAIGTLGGLRSFPRVAVPGNSDVSFFPHRVNGL